MPAASPNAARSRRWRKAMTSRSRRIARSARSRSPPACSSPPARPNVVHPGDVARHPLQRSGARPADLCANPDVADAGRRAPAHPGGAGPRHRDRRGGGARGGTQSRTAGATRSGATPTAASPNGERQDGGRRASMIASAVARLQAKGMSASVAIRISALTSTSCGWGESGSTKKNSASIFSSAINAPSC